MRCQRLLGFYEPTRGRVRIKYQDLYLEIEGTNLRIKGPCPRCVANNELSDASPAPSGAQDG